MVSNSSRYAWLAVAVAVLTVGAKSAAAFSTGSVGLLSDAAEGLINLASSAMLVVILRIAQAPPDPDHPFGHDKAEYFANGVQGTLIFLAGAAVGVTAVQRFLHPKELEAGALGISLAVVAGLINLITARYLSAQGKKLRSHALQGEAEHLMSDVWTSLAVVVGVSLVYLTEIPWLDPMTALAAAIFITATGVRLVRAAVKGLMDTALPEKDQLSLIQVLDEYREQRGIDFHALRSRVSGKRTFVSVHILVPGLWTVTRGHDLLEELEKRLSESIGGASVLTHLEPIDDPCSFDDMEIT